MKISKSKLKKLIIESAEELEYFGDGIKSLIDNPGQIKTPDHPSNSNIADPNNIASIEAQLDKVFGKVRSLGAGAFRQVYGIPGRRDIAIKIAHSENVMARNVRTMNLKEIELFNKYPEFFPKVYSKDPSNLWFIIERVVPVKGKKSFDSFVSYHFNFTSYDFLYDIIKEMMIAKKCSDRTIGMLKDDISQIKDFSSKVFGAILSSAEQAFHDNSKEESQTVLKKHFFMQLRHILFTHTAVSLFGTMYRRKAAAIASLLSKKHNVPRFILDYRNFFGLITSFPNEAQNIIIINAAIEKIYKSFVMNRKFNRMIELLLKEGVNLWDLRSDNIGTSVSGDRFVIIDAGIF